jgi:hypothetical protein
MSITTDESEPAYPRTPTPSPIRAGNYSCGVRIADALAVQIKRVRIEVDILRPGHGAADGGFLAAYLRENKVILSIKTK